MINYPGTNRHHFLFFYHLGVARVVPGHFTILFFSIILSVTVDNLMFAAGRRRPVAFAGGAKC